jgi:hypothetical protein
MPCFNVLPFIRNHQQKKSRSKWKNSCAAAQKAAGLLAKTLPVQQGPLASLHNIRKG